jgi:hypothetical protein
MKMENKKRYLPNYTTTYEINNYINQRKTPDKGTREEKRKDPSPNKRPHPKVQNAHWGTYSICYSILLCGHLRCYPFECRAYNSVG